MDPAAHAALAALTRRPGFLLSRVGTAVQAGFKQTLTRWQLKPLHFLVLVVLAAIDGTSQRDLCQLLKIDSGNMVELLDHLEELGWAQRSPDPSDRRRHRVTITEPGRENLGEIIAAVQAFDDEFLGPLTEPERTRLVATLGKLFLNSPEGRREAPPVGLERKDGGR